MGVFLALALAAGVVFWLVRKGRVRPGRSRIRCEGCAHLRRRFDDGVMCGYGSKEVFKTPAHIRMCGDWEAARRR